ncbi:MAG TPA: SCP2 sterol-binding domain-containing protein [Burkholderiaceae bacterium]|nr:SCP2 sterol-binding domain-containing protein [Burkholderiaceae bacterium]
MIDQIASSAAIALLNRMLAREQWARDKLAPFADRSARFDVSPFSVTLQVTNDGTFVVSNTGEPAVTIGVTLSSLPLAMLDPQAALRDVRLSGDAEFAQALAFVLQNLRPEPEEELSRFIGDAAAQRLVGFMRASAMQWKQLAENMLDSTAHYVVTENPMVVGRDDLETFNQDVNQLRDAVARIEKRINLLMRSQ